MYCEPSVAFGLKAPARLVETTTNGAVMMAVDVFGCLSCALLPRAQVLRGEMFPLNELPESGLSRSFFMLIPV